MSLTRVDRTVLATEVYERIREAIFNGDLLAGTRLGVQEIAGNLGVSSQPVKEALSRLGLEGLVVIKARSGTYVRTISAEDIEHILTARLMLETFAVTHIVEYPSDGLMQLERALLRLEAVATAQPFQYMAYNESDILFHETLVGMARNPVLLRLYRSLHAHYLTARRYDHTAQEKAVANEQDHRIIYDAIRAHRPEEAADAVRKLLAAKARLLQMREDIT